MFENLIENIINNHNELSKSYDLEFIKKEDSIEIMCKISYEKLFSIHINYIEWNLRKLHIEEITWLSLQKFFIIHFELELIKSTEMNNKSTIIVKERNEKYYFHSRECLILSPNIKLLKTTEKWKYYFIPYLSEEQEDELFYKATVCMFQKRIKQTINIKVALIKEEKKILFIDPNNNFPNNNTNKNFFQINKQNKRIIRQLVDENINYIYYCYLFAFVNTVKIDWEKVEGFAVYSLQYSPSFDYLEELIYEKTLNDFNDFCDIFS